MLFTRIPLLLLLLHSTLTFCLGNDQDGGKQHRQLRYRRLLGVCEGDCDSNDDCDGDLVCFHRSSGEAVPTCDNVASDREDICIPEWLHPRPEIENLPSIFISPQRPLPLCGGDCDRDSDCSGDLVCYQRNRGGDPIPGCRGFDLSRTDYCIRPDADTKPPIPDNFPNEYFREIVFDLTMTYPSSTVNRQPTQEEYDGLAVAMVTYVDALSDASYAAAQSYQYVGSEVVAVTEQSQFRWVAIMKATFRANEIMAVPNAYWYSQMIRNDQTGAVLTVVRNAPPTTSIFRQASTVRREVNPYLGETSAPRSGQGNDQNHDLFD